MTSGAVSGTQPIFFAGARVALPFPQYRPRGVNDRIGGEA